MACCGQGGYADPNKVAVLAVARRIAARHGLDLPDRLQVWGPADGKAWRIVDWRGRYVGVYGMHSLPKTAAADSHTVVVELAGQLRIAPA